MTASERAARSLSGAARSKSGQRPTSFARVAAIAATAAAVATAATAAATAAGNAMASECKVARKRRRRARRVDDRFTKALARCQRGAAYARTRLVLSK